MTRCIASRVFLWTLLAMLAAILAGADRAAVGQDKQADAKPAAAKKPRKSRGRLPNYYRAVVDQEQRETIYKIQEEYRPKVAALRAQLAALLKERDEKIAAVLTPEQLKKVEEAKAAAKAKREQKKAAREKPPAETPAPEAPAD